MPVLQRRAIKHKQLKNDKLLEHQDIPAAPTNLTSIEHPSVTSRPLENSSQVLYKITQDASTQVEEQHSIAPSQRMYLSSTFHTSYVIHYYRCNDGTVY